MDVPNAAHYEGYDIDLHYDEDGGEWYCSAWLDGKGVHDEPDGVKSCTDHSGAPTKKKAIAKAKSWLKAFII